MITRQAEPRDLPACSDFEWTRPSVDLLWHIEAGLLFLVEDRGQTVAYARVESFWQTMPYLALIVVAEAHRGRGIGTALLQFICGELRSRGHASLLSSSTAGEEGPRRWHLRNQFLEVGALARLNKDGSAEVFYRLDLTH